MFQSFVWCFPRNGKCAALPWVLVSEDYAWYMYICACGCQVHACAHAHVCLYQSSDSPGLPHLASSAHAHEYKFLTTMRMIHRSVVIITSTIMMVTMARTTANTPAGEDCAGECPEGCDCERTMATALHAAKYAYSKLDEAQYKYISRVSFEHFPTGVPLRQHQPILVHAP